jgi:hypothetical protein
VTYPNQSPRPGPPPGGFRPTPPPGGFRPAPPPGQQPGGQQPGGQQPGGDQPGQRPAGQQSGRPGTHQPGQQQPGQQQPGGDQPSQQPGTPTQEYRVGATGGTGHPAVDAVLQSLANAATLAPGDQIAEYEAAHQVLQETLAGIDR